MWIVTINCLISQVEGSLCELEMRIGFLIYFFLPQGFLFKNLFFILVSYRNNNKKKEKYGRAIRGVQNQNSERQARFQ